MFSSPRNLHRAVRENNRDRLVSRKKVSYILSVLK